MPGLLSVQQFAQPQRVNMLMKTGQMVDQLQRAGVKDVAREVICEHGKNTNNESTTRRFTLSFGMTFSPANISIFIE